MDCDDAARIYCKRNGVDLSEEQLAAWHRRYEWEFGANESPI
jgi:hypothetical protein